jgi:transcriptional regulator with XRE-family HTH domain
MGAAVRGAIAQAGLTQAEAATRADMHLNTLSRRINGLLPFTWSEIVRLADVTSTSPTELASTAMRLASLKQVQAVV